MPPIKKGTCCCLEGPEDPCNPGDPFTPYIWFDQDQDGNYEDGPYAMVYDETLEAWIYTLVQSYTITGFELTAIHDDELCQVILEGTVTLGFFYYLKAGPDPLEWLWGFWSYFCCEDEFGDHQQQENVTTITWVDTGPGNYLTADPLWESCDPEVGNTDGYSFINQASFTDACENRLVEDTTADIYTPFVITRGSASPV